MSKVTVRIDEDERYPDYHVRNDRFGYEVEVEQGALDRWRAATEAYAAAQSEMGELMEAAAEVARETAAREKAAKEAAEKAERERVSQERQRVAEECRAQGAAMRTKIEESGGVLYDADGEPVAAVTEGPSGFRLEPRS